ncbi:MAG: PucR family transcriptional regulator ligand-binding domain-containing protein [Acetobacterium woodii]|nr:PucR family transcriptional regulator ligand-binding domain-containing protein [Acetobacterium woodii]
MAITLNHLCKYSKENYGMNLICGDEKLNNLVNWVHMLEDPETAGFLHGQELIFSTGIGHPNTDWLIEFAEGLIEHQASGLVLNIGPYIKAVPEDLIEFCSKMKFPLFTIPWKTRIVDITNDFCRKIIKAEENEITVAGAFRDAIFFPEKSLQYRSVLERKEFDLDAEYHVVALSLKDSGNGKLFDFDKKIRMQLMSILYQSSDRFNIFRQDQYLIIVLQNFSQHVIENAIRTLDELCRVRFPQYMIHGGIGAGENGILSLAKNYKRAIAVLHLAEKQQEVIKSYNDIGFYQLLIEVEDTNVLKRFYKDTLGQLEDYDRKNQTDYLDTLKAYLLSNGSIQEVAKTTYVHRNTVNYKIKKIKEILQCELTYQNGLELILALNIKEIM